MARTLSFSGELQWPLEDGKQAAKAALTASLNYTAALAIEKVFATAVTDEVIALPMTSVKFLMLQAKTNDISMKLNAGADITLKAGASFLLVWNPDGAVTSLKVTNATAPATLVGYAFA